MKKLLIIMLVLGIATAANAALSWEIRDTGGSTVSGDLTVDDDYVLVLMGTDDLDPIDGYLWYGDWSKITVSNPQVLENNGDLGSNNYYTAYSGYAWGAAQSLDPTPPVTDGDWASWDFSADTVGTGSFDFYNYNVSSYYVEGTQTFNIVAVVPEPITIALLGLGGLFLRRRK